MQLSRKIETVEPERAEPMTSGEVEALPLAGLKEERVGEGTRTE